MNRNDAIQALKTRQKFASGNLKGYYPFTRVYPDGGMIYVVKSYSLPIAVWDGDVWHLLDSDFLTSVTSKHMDFVKFVVGTHDAYSMYPVVPTKASMDALIERLVNR